MKRLQFEDSTKTVKMTVDQFTNLFYKKLNVDEVKPSG